MPGPPGGSKGGVGPPQDAELRAIARARRGDVSAFNTLVMNYQAQAYGLALRMLGDADAAADVTQDAFFSAFRHIASYRGASFQSWLLRIVSNGCYDYWRSQRRKPTSSLDALGEFHGDDTGEGTGESAQHSTLIEVTWNPENLALRREVIATIETALLQLSPDLRLAVILSDIQGLAYDEIAQVTGVPLGTVKSRIARGRSRLREMLSFDGEPRPQDTRHTHEAARVEQADHEGNR